MCVTTIPIAGYIITKRLFMKKQYMVEFELPEVLTNEFTRLIPAQREAVNLLFSKGSLKSYSLATDRSVMWAVFTADSEFEVLEMVSQFPLADFMTPYISELMFHSSDSRVMNFSLN